MKRIMLDIDGVLADFTWRFTALFCEMFPGVIPGPISQADQLDYGYSILPAEERKQTWDAFKARPELLLDLPPIVSQDTFARIDQMQREHHLAFVTSRKWLDELLTWRLTLIWLEKHGIKRPQVDLEEKKGEYAVKNEATHYLDDKAGNAVYTAYHSPKTKCYLVDRKYNQFDHGVLGSKVTRVPTVDAFLDIVEADK